MNNGYLQDIMALEHELANNKFESLELFRRHEIFAPKIFDKSLAITVEAYTSCSGTAVQNRVDLCGNEHPVRILGLILVSRAISAPAPAMLVKLETDSDINLLCLDPIKAELDFYDCVPKVLEYKFCAAVDEYSRESVIVADHDRPSFHYLSINSRNDKTERLMREIPDWVENILIIQGTANSALRLGAMLLDLTHPSRPGGGLMHLQRRFEQVCALTYSIDWELRLTD